MKSIPCRSDCGLKKTSTKHLTRYSKTHCSMMCNGTFYRVAIKDPHGAFVVRDVFHTRPYAEMLYASLKNGCTGDIGCAECRLSLTLHENGKFKETIKSCML